MFKLKRISILISVIIMNLSVVTFAVEAGDIYSDDGLIPRSDSAKIVSTEVGNGKYPLIRLTPEKLEMIELEQDAASVFVGNPAHLNVLLDTPNTLVLVPRQVGATHFKVINSTGDVIMERHVIVASPKQDFVRIRRTCAIMGGDSEQCKEYSIFFCPDMCHNVALSDNEMINNDMDSQEIEYRNSGDGNSSEN